MSELPKKDNIRALFPRPDPQKCNRGLCSVSSYKIRRRKTVTGGYQYCWQCLECGERLGSALKQGLIQEVRGTPPEFDEDLLQRKTDERDAKSWRDYMDRVAVENGNGERWRQVYEAYLKTRRWHMKREAVIKRCGGICEGCGQKRNLQVHHTTYRNLGNELLFELIGLCKQCHERAHEPSAVTLEEIEAGLF